MKEIIAAAAVFICAALANACTSTQSPTTPTGPAPGGTSPSGPVGIRVTLRDSSQLPRSVSLTFNGQTYTGSGVNGATFSTSVEPGTYSLSGTCSSTLWCTLIYHQNIEPNDGCHRPMFTNFTIAIKVVATGPSCVVPGADRQEYFGGESNTTGMRNRAFSANAHVSFR